MMKDKIMKDRFLADIGMSNVPVVQYEVPFSIPTL